MVDIDDTVRQTYGYAKQDCCRDYTRVEGTRPTGAVDRIPGTAICSRPAAFEFAAMGQQLGYRVRMIDGPYDVMLTEPEQLAAELREPG